MKGGPSLSAFSPPFGATFTPVATERGALPTERRVFPSIHVAKTHFPTLKSKTKIPMHTEMNISQK
jgi:hypothetical protein